MPYINRNLPYSQQPDEDEYAQLQAASDPGPQSPSIFPGPRQNYAASYRPYSQRFVSSTNNAQDAARQDRDFAYGRYNDIDAELTNGYDRSQGEYDRYSNSGDQVYDDLYSRPGYSADQFGRITQYNGDLDGLQQSQEESESSYMSPDERSAYFGDPDRAKNQNFDPGYENSIQGEGFARQNEATAYAEGSYRDDVHPEDSLVGENYGKSIRGTLDTGSRGIEDSLNRQDAAVTRDKLTLSDGFGDRYRMSDADKQAMVTTAGQDVGAMYRGQMDDIARKAEAQGTNPLGVAALQARLQKRAAIEGADAMTRARLAAGDAQAGREMNYEQARLDAERGYSDRAVGVAQNRANALDRQQARTLDAYSTEEGLRQQGVNARNSTAARRAEYVGNARMENARNQAHDSLGLAVDQSNRGYQMDRASEETQSQRNLTAAKERIAGSQYNQGQRYSRGMDRFGVRTGQNQAAVNAERADRQEARGYVTHKQDASQQNSQFYAGQRTNMYGQGTQAGNTATRNQLTHEQIQAGKPSFWDRISGVARGMMQAGAGA